MPSVSKKQHNFMEAIAHGMKPKGGKGPSKAVAEDFAAADKGHKFGSGGHVKKKHRSKPRLSNQMLAALAAPPPPPPGPPGPPMGAGPPPMGGPPPGMKRGGQIKTTKTEGGGSSRIGGGIERKGKTSTGRIAMKGAGRAAKGTTPTRMYAGGGAIRGGGCESSGKTRGRFV